MGDSGAVVTPFVQVATYATRNFATLGQLELLPPFTGSPGMCRFPNQKIGEHPFSRSYGVILPSSFDMVLSSALVAKLRLLRILLKGQSCRATGPGRVRKALMTQATQMFQFAKFEKSKERRLATELGYGFPIGDPWITDGISPWPFASESIIPSQCPGIHPKHSLRSCTRLLRIGYTSFGPACSSRKRKGALAWLCRRKKNLRILSPGARVKDQSKLGSALGSQTSPLQLGQLELRSYEQGSS
ncbi:hypothetical protein SASPL_125389 [Salvia splendens]|uniref:Mitochondrial protein n=1 Tax=Salvia splendens TaxID=180675 RepID=A0A8X8XHK6_SALSN|nr:hypothetical protein SASPL_125389 [Salvia splendens]